METIDKKERVLFWAIYVSFMITVLAFAML